MRRAIAFLTPLGGAVAPSPAALPWFPVVGAGIGLALSAVWIGAGDLWPRDVAAALVVAADLFLTGMLHLDGLVDAADGLLPPHAGASTRLAVMADPVAGSFGVGTAIAILLLRWAALAALPVSWLLLPAIWCISRTVMAVVTRSVPYARPGGLAEPFRSGQRSGTVGLAVAGAAAATGLAVVSAGAGGAAAVAATILAGGAVVALAVRRVGGFTGDVLGAAGMVGETVGLLVAATRW